MAKNNETLANKIWKGAKKVFGKTTLYGSLFVLPLIYSTKTNAQKNIVEEWEAPKKQRSPFGLRLNIEGGLYVAGVDGYSSMINPQIKLNKNLSIGPYFRYNTGLRTIDNHFENPETRDLINETPQIYYVIKSSGDENLKIWNPYELGILFSSGLAKNRLSLDIGFGLLSEKSEKKVIIDTKEYLEVFDYLIEVDTYSSDVIYKDNKALFEGGALRTSLSAKVYPFAFNQNFLKGIYMGVQGSFTTGLDQTIGNKPKSYGSFQTKIGYTFGKKYKK